VSWNSFIDGVLDTKLLHHGTYKISLKKNLRFHIQIKAITLKMASYGTMSKNKNKK
jgi:hypothetical protein